MWFQFPEGCSEVSVEQQNFLCEFTDAAGRGYFRAPDHFAAQLFVVPGFAAVDPPEGAPEDTTATDTLRDDAIRQLAGQITTLQRTVGEERQAHDSLLVQFTRQQAELEALAREKAELVEQVRGLEEELEGFRAPTPKAKRT